MARSTTLSDEAFGLLRSLKRPGESDSDVVLRLAHEARIAKKDPLRFVRRKARFAFSEEEHAQMIQEGDEADRNRDPWAA